MNELKLQHKNVFVALCAAQGEMESVTKSAANGAFKKPDGTISRYANLASVVDAVRPALSKHGLSFYHQMVECLAVPSAAMRTTLSHGESETSICCDVPLIFAVNTMQGMKSATTYAKRVGLESITGVAPEDDDDGNAASATKPIKVAEPDTALLELANNAAKQGVLAYRAFYKDLKPTQRSQISSLNTEYQIIATDADKVAAIADEQKE